MHSIFWEAFGKLLGTSGNLLGASGELLGSETFSSFEEAAGRLVEASGSFWKLLKASGKHLDSFAEAI